MSIRRAPSAATNRVGIAIGVLGLIAAGTSAGYSAGLAKNSVGTEQLKNDAVTSAKIKKGGVDTSDLSKGAQATKVIDISRQLPEAGPLVPVAKVAGVSFLLDCFEIDADAAQIVIYPSPKKPKTLGYHGTFIYRSEIAGVDDPFAAVADKANEFSVTAYGQTDLDKAVAVFTGVVERVGQKPLLVTLTSSVVDGAAKPCSFRLVIAPTA